MPPQPGRLDGVEGRVEPVHPQEAPFAGQVIWEHEQAQPYAGLRLPVDRDDPWSGTPLHGSERFAVPAAHWSALVSSWVGPVVILLTVGEHNLRVREHSRRSLNFEITIAVLMAGAALLTMLAFLPGVIAVAAVAALWLLARVIGALRAARGRLVRYRGAIPFIRG